MWMVVVFMISTLTLTGASPGAEIRVIKCVGQCLEFYANDSEANVTARNAFQNKEGHLFGTHCLC